MRVLLGVGIGLLAAVPAAAQVALEVHGGTAIGSHSSTLAGLDFQPRVQAEAIGKKDIGVDGRLRVFASGAFTWFGCTEEFCGGASTVDVRNYALTAGLEYNRFGCWARGAVGAGMTDIRGSTETGLATSAAVGARVGVGWGFALTPGVTYRWMYGGGAQTLSVGVGLGLSYRLGGAR